MVIVKRIATAGTPLVTVVEEAGNFTISKAAHNNTIVELTSPLTITVDITEEGVSCRFVNLSGGTITFVAGTATITGGINSAKTLTEDSAGADIYFKTAGVARLVGDLVV